MELHELHIGYGRTGAIGHGDTVSCCHIGVAGIKIYLAGTASCQKSDLCLESFHLAAGYIQDMGADAAIGFDPLAQDLRFSDQIDADMVFINGDIFIGPGSSHQRLWISRPVISSA